MRYCWLDDAIADGATVLAASRRLARELGVAYADARRQAGTRAWRTPAIYYWQDWLGEVFAEAVLADRPLLLTAAASTMLWEQCLERTAAPAVLSQGAIVRHARLAWQRLHEWRVPLAELARQSGNHDERWFCRAAYAYDKKLRDNDWLDFAELPAKVESLAAQRCVGIPGSIVQVGFDRVVPALAGLLDGLGQLGCAVTAAPVPAMQARPHVVRYPDAAAQWRAAGAFARRVRGAEPEARVGIVAPDLDVDGDAVARLVREGYAPGWQLGGSEYRSAIDVSYGRRLADYPLIAVALLCLNWSQRGLRGSELSILLRSCWVGDDDLDGRCRIERFLRNLPDRAWSVRDFLALCRGQQFAGQATGWCQRMARLAQQQAAWRQRRSPAACAQWIDGMLAAAGWPGLQQPDSEEFQLANRWRALLNDFARSGSVQPLLGAGEAVRQVCRMAMDTLYQPEAQPGAIHLIGMLEAAGLEFDYLWIGGLDANQWPPHSQPLSLLPRRLQRQHAMPDCTPADTLVFARHVFARRCGGAGSVTCSWPASEQDAELAPSPLLVTANCAITDGADDPGWYAATLAGNRPYEWPAADTGPPVTDGERIRGGAYTVQQQQENPFTAFAQGRLGVSELEVLQSGLSYRHRGSLLHRALQHLLADKPSRGVLSAWAGDALDARIASATDAALRELRTHADTVLQKLLTLEGRRMRALLRDFIAEEVRREDFVVESIEESLALRQGAVALSLRVDRIDRLADGRYLIIDYKSGRERNLLARDGSLADMQLGVYARALQKDVGGLLLINLDSRYVAYNGAGGSVPWGRISPQDWPTALAAWCARVDELITAMASGDLRLNLMLTRDKLRPLAVLSRVEELRRGE